VRDLVVSKSVARLQDLGRAFVAQNNARLASLIQSKGVDSEVRNGEVYVSRKSLGLLRVRRSVTSADQTPCRFVMRSAPATSRSATNLNHQEIRSKMAIRTSPSESKPPSRSACARCRRQRDL